MFEDKIKKELKQVLEQELVLHKELLSLLEQEKEALLEKTDELEEITKRKDFLVEEIRRQLSHRQALIFNIANLLALKPNDINLTFLAKRWRDASFLEIKKEFQATLEEIKQKQKFNQHLIHQGLEFIRECLNILHSQPHRFLYDSKGDLKESSLYQQNLDRSA